MSTLPGTQPQMRIADDLACAHCRYNLRGLSDAGNCPECGTPVAYSLHGFYLRNAPLAWLRRLPRGLIWILISLVVGAGLLLAVLVWAMVVGLMASMSPSGGPDFDISGYTRWVLGLAFLLAQLAGFRGVWLLTSPNPDDEHGAAGQRLRSLLRSSSWLVLATIPLEFVEHVIPDAWDVGALGVTVGLMSASGFFVAMFVLLLAIRYCGALLRRIPRPGLARFAAVEFWGLLITAICAVGGMAFSIGMAAAPTSAFGAAPAAAGPNDPNAAAEAPAALPAAASTAPATTTPAATSTTAVSATTASAPTASAAAGSPTLRLGIVTGLTATILCCGSCANTGFLVAAFVLLTLTYAALRRVVREVEAAAPAAPRIPHT
jgi:hypothetical protein